MDIKERFWSKLPEGCAFRSDGTCWEWQGGRNNYGYGMFFVDGTKVPAHRFAYELLIAPIPAGLVIDHLCRNRLCCNPRHLEAVTHKVNITRGRGAGWQNGRKTHCPSGHPYDASNTHLWRGKRYCKTCARGQRTSPAWRRS